MDQRYDDATKAFLGAVHHAQPTAPAVSEAQLTAPAVSGAQPPRPEQAVIKQVVSTARAVLAPNPGAAISKLVMRKGIGALAHESFDKQAQESVERHIPPVDVLDAFTAFNEKYGHEWWDWEPETVVQTVEHDFGHILHGEGVNTVSALQLVLKTNQAHENWHVFEKVCLALNGSHVDFALMQQPELEEVAYTLRVLKAIRPKEEFDDEIHGYIAAVAKSAGVVYLPEGLFDAHCQEALDKLGNDPALKAKVQKAWPAAPDVNADAALYVQLSRLHEAKQYATAYEGQGA